MIFFVGLLSFNNLGLVMADEVTEVENQEELTTEEIQQRFEEINNKYEVGEAFSKEDAEFVLKYGNKVPKPGEIKPAETYGKIFNGQNSSFGITANIWGFWQVEARPFDGEYYVELNTETSSKVDKIKNEVRFTAYGIVGSGEIGIIYDRIHDTTCSNTTFCRMVVDQQYFGVGTVTTYVAPKATIYTKSGNFDVRPR